MFRRNPRNTNRNMDYPQNRKFKEKNILSAILGTATLVVLCASLVEPKWFYLDGGKCCRKYLGMNNFVGNFGGKSYKKAFVDVESCKTAEELEDNLFVRCVNTTALTVIQVVIGLIILAIFASAFSFILDVLAPRKTSLGKVLKRYAFGYIVTVIICATTVGFCFWASQEIYDLQHLNRLYRGTKITVSFGTGVYMVAAAGGLAVLATASNLMRPYPTEEEEQAEQLLEEESDEESDGVWSNVVRAGGPPPYVP